MNEVYRKTGICQLNCSTQIIHLSPQIGQKLLTWEKMMKDLLIRLGARMKEIRKSQGLTQDDVAERADMSPRYLSRLEGGHQSPSVEMLARLAKALAVEIWELFDFGHIGARKEVEHTARTLIRQSDDERLRLAVKVLRAIVR